MFKTLSFASQKMLARDALDIYLKKDIDIRILFHENGEERIGRVKILFASKVKNVLLYDDVFPIKFHALIATA